MMHRFNSCTLSVIVLLPLLVTFSFAADATDELTEGQQKIKELSFMVGEWDVTDNEGKVVRMSVRPINNDSFLELISAENGDYREITRWDMAEKRFITNAFGTHGGHGTIAWSKAGDNGWKGRGKTPFYWASGEPNECDLTLTSVDKDTMTYVGSIGDTKSNNTARRRKPKPEPQISKDWRKFWVGDWHRVTEWTVDGETQKSEYDFTCKASGNAHIAFGTTGNGYAVTYAWTPDRNALVEVGHSADADWEIVFRDFDQQTIKATSTGRMSDGRRGIGTNTIKRTGPNFYTSEATIKLDDGSIVHVIDHNTRR